MKLPSSVWWNFSFLHNSWWSSSLASHIFFYIPFVPLYNIHSSVLFLSLHNLRLIILSIINFCFEIIQPYDIIFAVIDEGPVSLFKFSIPNHVQGISCVLLLLYWVVHLPFVRMVKLQLLIEFPVDHVAHLVVPSLILFYANLLHSLIMWLIVSSLSPYNHLLFCWVLSIFVLIWLVLMAWFCTAIKRDSVSLLMPPFLSYYYCYYYYWYLLLQSFSHPC